MNRKEIEKKVIEGIAIQISLEIDEISPTKNLINELGFDSLDSVEMIMFLENEFNISINEEVAEKLVTISLIVDYLESILNTKG